MSGFVNTVTNSEILSELPYKYYMSSAVSYDGRLHILGGFADYSSEYLRKHYSWDGNNWTEESTLPIDFVECIAVVCNNKIHIFGTTAAGNLGIHYSWDGSSWSEEPSLPSDISYTPKFITALNDKIYIVTEQQFEPIGYSYDPTNNSYLPSNVEDFTSIDLGYPQNRTIGFNNKIYFVTNIGDIPHIFWYDPEIDGGYGTINNWPLPELTGSVVSLVVHDRLLHIIYRNNHHYSWDGDTFVGEAPKFLKEVDVLKQFASYVSFDGRINALGEYNQMTKDHYSISICKIKKIRKAYFPVKTGYEILPSGKPALTYENRKVKRAWMQTDSSAKPLLVLEAIPSYYKYFNMPINMDNVFFISTTVQFNNKIHVIYKNNHASFDGNKWVMESPPPFTYHGRQVVVANNKIHVLGYMLEDISAYTRKNAHYSWDGFSWIKEKDLPFDLDEGGAAFVDDYYPPTATRTDEIHIIENTNHYAIKEDGTNYKVSTIPFKFYYGLAFYDVDSSKYVLIGGDMDRGSSDDIYYHYVLDDSSSPYWERSIHHFPESVGMATQGSCLVLYDRKGVFTDGGFSFAIVITYNKMYKIAFGDDVEEIPFTIGISPLGGYVEMACIFNDQLHLLTSYYRHFSGTTESLYGYDGFTFTELTNYPVQYLKGVSIGKQLVKCGDKICTFGGKKGPELNPKNQIKKYSLLDDVWTFDQDPESNPFSYVYLDFVYFATEHNGKIYALAEWASSSYNELAMYVCYSDNRWSLVEKYSQGSSKYLREDWSSGLISLGGKLYLVGGYWEKSAKYLCVTTNGGRAWTTLRYVPDNVLGGKAVVYNDKIHVIKNGYHYSYDPDANQWTNENTNPPIGIPAVHNNTMYLFSRNEDKTYNSYYLKNSKWVVSDRNLDYGCWPITDIIPFEDNFYLFSDHEVYRTNLERYFS